MPIQSTPITGNEIRNTAARWARLATELRSIANEVGQRGGDRLETHRQRVAVLCGRECVALGVDVGLSSDQIVTGSWALADDDDRATEARELVGESARTVGGGDEQKIGVLKTD